MYQDDSLITHQHEGILRVNTKGYILSLSSQAQHLLGLPNPDNTNIFTAYEFLDTSSFKPLKPKIILNDGSRWIIKVESAEKTKYLSASFSATIHDGEYLVSLYDTTHLIEKVVASQQDEYHQRLLVSSINDIIFEVDKDGIILNYWTNKPELLIQSPSKFLNKSISNVLVQDVSRKIVSLIRNSIEENKENYFEYEIAHTTQGIKWYSLTIKTIPDQTEIVAIVITDITKQKEYQDKLIFSERKFYQVFHFSGIGTTLTSLNGFLIEGNNTVSEILGYTKEELQQTRTLDITHPEDKDFDVIVRNELIEGKRNYQTFLKRYLHKGGYYVWCSVTISLVRDTKKNPKYFIAQLVDMTDYIRNNEELRLRKKNLETIKAHLESKILQIEEANHIIAHNFLSPIANIKMLIDNITQTQNFENIAIFLDLLKSSCNDLDETVEDLNSINSRIDRAKIKYEIEKCNFKTVLEKIINIKHPLIIKKNATIKIDFQIEEINTERVTLYSIIDQLIDNALQFSDPKRNPIIQIRTYYDEDAITLSIEDNGMGMDLEQVKSQLFMFKKIFHRGFDTKGIGLNITKYQIESLGGKIDVASKLGEGTTFFVKFPIISL